jgi:hypothetical protein
MNQSQNRFQARKSPALAAAAIALFLLAQPSAANASGVYSGPSLGAHGSADAVEHQLLSRPGPSLGAYGSANAVEHRLISRPDARRPRYGR